MSTMTSERSWLLNPGLLKLVHQCRRLIQSEFGVKLHLTEDRLEYRLAEYASKSRSSHLLRTWETLKPQIPNLEIEMPEAEETAGRDSGTAAANKPKRMYRGQPVADDEAPNASAKRQKRVYRGQVID